jgi:thiosulfate/3-mercaptopyruvate sulfurtransferase
MIRSGAILLCVLAGVAAAQTPETMLVSTEWLAGRLNDESLVILHVGTAKDYESGHIPGAHLMTLQDISVTGPRNLRLELPPVESLVRAFGKLGVADRSRVVVYPGNESVQSATRVWFTLDYLGLGDRASLLDGGLAAWRAEGRPVSTEVPKPRPATFTARPRKDVLVDAAWILSRAKDPAVQVLDARTPEYYTGASTGVTWKAGRIPGARNVPFTSMLDRKRKLKPAGELRSLLSPVSNPGVTVAYCHLGQQATLVYFAARYLGMKPRLYDGSFQDWSTRLGLPVESGAPTQ